MAYVDPNYKSKKAFKEAVAAGIAHRPYSPGPFPFDPKSTTTYIEGPHYPAPHKWYAECRLEDGVVVSVK